MMLLSRNCIIDSIGLLSTAAVLSHSLITVPSCYSRVDLLQGVSDERGTAGSVGMLACLLACLLACSALQYETSLSRADSHK